MGLYETQEALTQAMINDLYDVTLVLAKDTVEIVQDNVARYVYDAYPASENYPREYDNNKEGSFWASWDWDDVTRSRDTFSFEISSHPYRSLGHPYAMTFGAREHAGLGFPLANIHSSFAGEDYRPFMAQAVAEGWLDGWNAGAAEIARDYMTPSIEQFERDVDKIVLYNYMKAGVIIAKSR